MAYDPLGYYRLLSGLDAGPNTLNKAAMAAGLASQVQNGLIGDSVQGLLPGVFGPPAADRVEQSTRKTLESAQERAGVRTELTAMRRNFIANDIEAILQREQAAALTRRAPNSHFVPAGAGTRCVLFLENDPYLSPGDQTTSADERRQGGIRGIEFPLTREQVQITESYSTKVNTDVGVNASQPFNVFYGGGDWHPMQCIVRIHLADGITGERFLTPLQKGWRPDGVNAAQLDVALDDALREVQQRAYWVMGLALPKPTKRFVPNLNTSVRGAASNLNNAVPVQRESSSPSFVIWQIGNFLTLRGYITTTDVAWQPPFHPRTGRPYGAIVTCTFQPYWAFQPDLYSVSDRLGTTGASPRGASGTFTTEDLLRFQTDLQDVQGLLAELPETGLSSSDLAFRNKLVDRALTLTQQLRGEVQ